MRKFLLTIIVLAIFNFFASVYAEKKLSKYEEEKNVDTEAPAVPNGPRNSNN